MFSIVIPASACDILQFNIVLCFLFRASSYLVLHLSKMCLLLELVESLCCTDLCRLLRILIGGVRFLISVNMVITLLIISHVHSYG